MDASKLMAIASLTSAGSEGIGAFQQAGLYAQQGKWARESSEFSARMAELQAKDSERRGALAAQAIRSQGRRVVGAQRAALAAQGVDVSTGSAVDVQADTAYQAEADAQQTISNAWRESWGIRTQAQEGLFAGRMAEVGYQSKAAATALTGGLRLAGGIRDATMDYAAGVKSKPADTSFTEYKVGGQVVKLPTSYKLKPMGYR